MARIIALATVPLKDAPFEIARSFVVCFCALALITACSPLPGPL